MRSVGIGAWRLGERLGIDVLGSTEGPRYALDDERRRTCDALVAAAQDEDGEVDVAGCPFPIHELLTFLVVERNLLLHGSKDASLEVLEPGPRATSTPSSTPWSRRTTASGRSSTRCFPAAASR
jgi:hypothetical protein